jgi:hypothetical protein
LGRRRSKPVLNDRSLVKVHTAVTLRTTITLDADEEFAVSLRHGRGRLQVEQLVAVGEMQWEYLLAVGRELDPPNRRNQETRVPWASLLSTVQRTLAEVIRRYRSPTPSSG